MPINHKVFLAQFDAIKKIADEGPCILVGRCADYALESYPNVVSVFIHADMQSRIRRIARLYDLTDAKAKDLIVKTDKKRASYYNYYTNKKWSDAESYELCLTSSELGIEGDGTGDHRLCNPERKDWKRKPKDLNPSNKQGPDISRNTDSRHTENVFLYAGNLSALIPACQSSPDRWHSVRRSFFAHAQCVPATRIYCR